MADGARVELLKLRAEKVRRIKENRLAHYRPYAKQALFHEAGRIYRERMLKAGNQVGKTWSAGFEMAMHLTGRYPAVWNGHRFDKPIAAWAAGITALSTRDTVQRVLLGRKGAFGTGAIPAACIAGKPTWSRSCADAVDTILIRHESGGKSTLTFKSYEQDREKWQGETLDLVWFDEEPPSDIYTEGLTRTNATRGIVMITYTPLMGMSEVTRMFLKNPTADRHVTNMTLDDAEHYTPEERARIAASYPAHEREARVNGTPMMGSGRIFPLGKEAVEYEAMAFPDYFRRIAGMDFGYEHPTAAVWLAFDPDADIIYVYDCYRVSKQTPVIHAAAIKARGRWIPMAWPHDGENETAAGEALSVQYREQDVNMLEERATFAPKTDANGKLVSGGNSVEAGLAEMLDRMQTGRLKVAKHLNDWWEEFLLYHREEGKVVKEMDDLMSATRYAMMMLRFATTKKEKGVKPSWRKLLAQRASQGNTSHMAA